MINGIIKLLQKYRSFILYLIFGVATTVINVVVYFKVAHVVNISPVFSTAIAWFFAVLFAYITNRIWVFESQVKGVWDIFIEATSFFGCRLGTGVLDVVVMYIFVEQFMFNDILIKILDNILVIILNYIASKWVIFRKRS